MDALVHVVGIGSPFGADRIGWRVVDELRRRPVVRRWGEKVRLSTLDRPGTGLMEQWRGADLVILVDGMLSGAAPGMVRCVRPDELRAIFSQYSSHGLGVAETFALAQALGSAPRSLTVIGVELTDDEGCQREAAASAATRVIDEVEKRLEISHA